MLVVCSTVYPLLRSLAHKLGKLLCCHFHFLFGCPGNDVEVHVLGLGPALFAVHRHNQQGVPFKHHDGVVNFAVGGQVAEGVGGLDDVSAFEWHSISLVTGLNFNKHSRLITTT